MVIQWLAVRLRVWLWGEKETEIQAVPRSSISKQSWSNDLGCAVWSFGAWWPHLWWEDTDSFPEDGNLELDQTLWLRPILISRTQWLTCYMGGEVGLIYLEESGILMRTSRKTWVFPPQPTLSFYFLSSPVAAVLELLVWPKCLPKRWSWLASAQPHHATQEGASPLTEQAFLRACVRKSWPADTQDRDWPGVGGSLYPLSPFFRPSAPSYACGYLWTQRLSL